VNILNKQTQTADKEVRRGGLKNLTIRPT